MDDPGHNKSTGPITRLATGCRRVSLPAQLRSAPTRPVTPSAKMKTPTSVIKIARLRLGQKRTQIPNIAARTPRSIKNHQRSPSFLFTVAAAP